MAVKLMVRGIYSTALVKLALASGGFEIVSPTESQRRRFGLSGDSETPDVTVVDMGDRHGIRVTGVREGVLEFIETVRQADDNAVTWLQGDDGATLSYLLSFPMQVKETMDKLRSEVTYTVPYHHYCRAGSEGLSLMVSLAEKIVEDGLAEPSRVSEMFRNEVSRLTPRIGSIVGIYHTKLTGKTVKLSPGKVIWRREGEVKILRRIMGNGVYDGLGIPKSVGDTAIMHIKRGQPYTVTKYYSINNILKGEYYNICTPVEVYDNYIRYVDLGVDVVKPAGGEPKIIDLDELERALSGGIISKHMHDWALNTAKEIASKV